jgi:hypothetical protein
MAHLQAIHIQLPQKKKERCGRTRKETKKKTRKVRKRNKEPALFQLELRESMNNLVRNSCFSGVRMKHELSLKKSYFCK